MAYIIDTNVFIQAKNLHYGFDFCPAFWEWIVAANTAGTVFSIDKVEDELVGLGDDLSDWASERGSGFFLRPDSAVISSLQKVSAWASGQSYLSSAVNLFLQDADYYLVAYAHAHSHVLVTHEVPPRQILKRRSRSRTPASAPASSA